MRSLVHESRRFAALLTLMMVGCSSDDPEPSKQESCTAGTTEGCTNNQVCEDTASGTPACFDPIRVAGKVIDALDKSGVEGALVVARDANGAAVSGTAATDAEGDYSLVVPVKRDAEGNPVAGTSYTLRADASGYQSFPTAPRVALPVDMTKAAAGVVQTTATDIGLIPLPTTTGLGTISGSVQMDDPAGTLVVAGSATALAATDGTFTIFNVPAGSVTVTAYRQGFNVDPATATVTANGTTKDIKLVASSKPAATVTGKVEIVNPGNGTDTSVILVVADTFVENAARGESPPGLRVADVSGEFSIEGVPDGKYVVLAAFENDFLVRDPDTCIGGTAIVTVTVAGSDVTLADSFKITGSLDVGSPDAEQVVTGTPTFVWEDDSSEDAYKVSVYDAFGTLVWEDPAVPAVTGSKNVTVTYGGPALTPGMIYQYRALSVRKDACAISRTEDLRGVFRIQ